MKEIKLIKKEDRYYIYYKRNFWPFWIAYDYYYSIEKANSEFEYIIRKGGVQKILKEHKF